MNWSWHWNGISFLWLSQAWMWTSISGFPDSELVEWKSDVRPGTVAVLIRVLGPSFSVPIFELLLSHFPELDSPCGWPLRAHFRCKVALSCCPSRKLFQMPKFTCFQERFFSLSSCWAVLSVLLSLSLALANLQPKDEFLLFLSEITCRWPLSFVISGVALKSASGSTGFDFILNC